MPADNPLPMSCIHRLHLPLMLVCAAITVSGCAQLPTQQALPPIKTPDAFASAESFRTEPANWPADQWWTAYGDRQLNTLIDEALQDAPDLMAANARLQRAEAFAQVAGSSLMPQVNAGANISTDKLSYNHLMPKTPATEGWNDYGRVSIDFTWELDFWGKNRAGLAAATSEREARRAEVAQTKLLLASGIAANYAELSRLHEKRQLAMQSSAIRKKTAELLAKRHANGLENRIGVRAADAARAVTESDLLAIDEHIALQRNRIAALMGQGPDRGLAIEPPQLKLDKSFGLPSHLSADLLGRRPDIAAARLMVQAQSNRMKQKKAEFYPNVNLSAFIGLQALGLDMLSKSGSGIGSFGPAISLPIFNGGRLQAELRGANAAYVESMAHYNATVAHALQDVADAAVSQKSLVKRLGKAQEAVDAASETHRLARNRYEGGLATYLEVLSAEETLLASLEQQTNLRAQSWTLDIALNRALGGGYLASSAPSPN